MELFENLPSKSTPITAERLNQIKDNLVVISATEPTGNKREKVWIQKGKNLFHGTVVPYSDIHNTTTDYIEVKPNTTYIFSSKDDTVTFSGNLHFFDESLTYLSQIFSFGTAFTTPENCYYLKVAIGTVENLPIGSKIQLEQGSTATEYEEYIDKKIYCKNDNGVYEEFVNIETITNENGTAIKYPDGTLECVGEGECDENVGYTDITFPVPFIDKNYIMLANHKYTSKDEGNYGSSIQLTNITNPQAYTNSTAYIYSYLYDGSVATYKRKVQYIAKGRWK